MTKTSEPPPHSKSEHLKNLCFLAKLTLMNECESSFRFDLWKSSDFSCFSFIYLFSFELTFFFQRRNFIWWWGKSDQTQPISFISSICILKNSTSPLSLIANQWSLFDFNFQFLFSLLFQTPFFTLINTKKNIERERKVHYHNLIWFLEDFFLSLSWNAEVMIFFLLDLICPFA